MNKLSLIVSTLCAFCSLTYAGSETYSGKEMKQVAPLPSPCPNWTGFYGGVFGGYKFGAIDTDLSLGGDWIFIPVVATWWRRMLQEISIQAAQNSAV
jgi:hypothetical protein